MRSSPRIAAARLALVVILAWAALGTSIAVADDPVIAAAGDIACDPGSIAFQGGAGTDAFCHELATSNLLLRRDLTAVLVLGDAQYEDGQYTKFLQSFDPSWGRLKAIEYATVGNHEVRSSCKHSCDSMAGLLCARA